MAWSSRAGTVGNAMPRERNSIRQKNLLRGIVYFEMSPFASECTVCDLSGSGARRAPSSSTGK
jgi:hypothetical protein